MVPRVSREILKLRTSDMLSDMEKIWFENQLPYPADGIPSPITLFRFRGLFIITGVSFAFALVVLLILWLRDIWEDLMSSVNIFLSQRLVHFRILFARTIRPNPLDDAAIGENAVQMAQCNNRQKLIQTQTKVHSVILIIPVLCFIWSESFWFGKKKSKFSFFGRIKDYHDLVKQSIYEKKKNLRNRIRQYHSPGSDNFHDCLGS